MYEFSGSARKRTTAATVVGRCRPPGRHMGQHADCNIIRRCGVRDRTCGDRIDQNASRRELHRQTAGERQDGCRADRLRDFAARRDQAEGGGQDDDPAASGHQWRRRTAKGFHAQGVEIALAKRDQRQKGERRPLCQPTGRAPPAPRRCRWLAYRPRSRETCWRSRRASRPLARRSLPAHRRDQRSRSPKRPLPPRRLPITDLRTKNMLL